MTGAQKAAATRLKKARAKDRAEKAAKRLRSLSAHKGWLKRKKAAVAAANTPLADAMRDAVGKFAPDDTIKDPPVEKDETPENIEKAEWPVFGARRPTTTKITTVGIAALLDRCDLALDTLEGKLQRMLAPEPYEGHGGPANSDTARALSALADRILELANRVDV